MHKTFLKYLFILITAVLFSNNFCYAKNINNYICLNTAPITIPDEENKEVSEKKEQKSPASIQVEKTTPVTVKTNKDDSTASVKIKPANYNTPIIKQNITKKNVAKKIKPLELVDFDAEENTLKTKDSESFLLVPIDKEQLEKENEKLKLDSVSVSLIKDYPKPLTIKSKFMSKIFGLKIFAKTSVKITFVLLVMLIFISAIGISGYFIYKQIKNKLDSKEKIKNLSYEEEKRKELIQAIEEFEETEKKHKKLGHKIYINKLETYKNFDGFKKDEVADDIIKTMETIENAQKNETPLGLKETATKGFKKNNFAFENDLGTLSEEEGIALFDEADEKIFNTEEEFLNPDYYNENPDIINDDEMIDNDIFIIEDEEEAEDNVYKIVEETSAKANTEENKPEQTEKEEEQEQPQKQEEEQEEQKTTPKQVKKIKPEPKLEIKEKYPLDDNRGLALLKYKNTIALIGYIDENITVLKRFSKNDNAENLSVRIYEELSDDTKQYLVRIGKYKGIIEFNPSEVKLVLNL